jgi:hypothetical protein
MSTIPRIAFTGSFTVAADSPLLTGTYPINRGPARESAPFYAMERSARAKRLAFMQQIAAALKIRRPRVVNIYKIKQMSITLLEHVDDLQCRDFELEGFARAALQRWIKMLYIFNDETKLTSSLVPYFQTDRLDVFVNFMLDSPRLEQWPATVQLCYDVSHAIAEKVTALEGQYIDTSRAFKCLNQDPASWFTPEALPAWATAQPAPTTQILQAAQIGHTGRLPDLTAAQALQALQHSPPRPPCPPSAKRYRA